MILRCFAGKNQEIISFLQGDQGRTGLLEALTDWSARDMDLDLSFLGEGDYVMDIFEDGINADRYAFRL